MTVEFLAFGNDAGTGAYFYEVLPLIHITWSDEAAPEPVPTATPTATVTVTVPATPTPTPTATVTVTATATPGTTLPPNATDEEVLWALLSGIPSSVFQESSFISTESQFLDCVERRTGARPASFDAVLGQYSGDTKVAVDTCDVETAIFDRYHEMAQTELAAMRVSDARYDALLNTESGRQFASRVGSPAITKWMAEIISMPRSAASAGTSSNEGETPEIVLPCVTGFSASSSLTSRMDALSCLIFDTDYQFWLDRNRDMTLEPLYLLHSDLLGFGDWECTPGITPDAPLPSCFKHDISWDSLQKFQPENQKPQADRAWNPRNKHLSDKAFMESIEINGCEGGEIGDTVICAGGLTNSSVANGFHWAVAYLNDYDWPITSEDMSHVTADPRFRECAEPVIPTLAGFNFDSSNFQASWDIDSGCVSDIELKHIEFCWLFHSNADDADFTDRCSVVTGDDTRRVTLNPALSITNTGARNNVSSVKLLSTRITPKNYEFGAEHYPDQPYDLEVIDSTLHIVSTTVSDYNPSVNTSAKLRTDARYWIERESLSYEWQRFSDSEWSTFMTTSSSTVDVVSMMAGHELYRVVVTHEPSMTVATSAGVRIDWVDAQIPVATNTPTPTATATPVLVPPPTNLTADPGTTSIDFDWRAPSGYSRFEVTFDGRISTISRSYFDATGLRSGRRYTIIVRTLASDRRKSAPRSLRARTLVPPTATPTPSATATPVPVPRVTNLTADPGTTSIDFDWRAPSGYSRFEVTFDGRISTISRSAFDATGLRSGRRYTIIVRTLASDGRKSAPKSLSARTLVPPTATPTPSATATPVPVPRVTNLTADPGTTSIDFDWRAPSGYRRFEVTFDGRISTISRSAFDATGLRSGRRYTISVRTVASDGRKSAPRSLSATTLDPPTATPTSTPTATPVPATVPAPTNLRHSAGTTWINFVWDAPSGHSDFEITFDGDTESVSRNSYFASGLNRGTPYRFSVKTDAGGDRYSSSVSTTVETTCSNEGSACSIGNPGVLYLFFGDGIHRVDVEIAPGTYQIGTPDDTGSCEWERLANLQGTSDQVIESGGWSDGLTVTIASSDAAFYSSGCGTWRLEFGS